jgi:uncharacterized protein DUF4389
VNVRVLARVQNAPVGAVTRRERPIRLVVTDDLQRSRLTVAFRLLLAIPHLFWLFLWSLAVFPIGFVIWLAVLFERRAPRVLHGFLASYIRYSTHLTAYLALAADPYPGFTGEPGYPVDVEIDPPAQQGRWGAGFRLLLAVPALMIAGALGSGAAGGLGAGGWSVGFAGLLSVVALLGWFACLARGRMPQGMRDLAVYAIGYGAQAYGYMLLLTDRYPSSDPALIEPATLPEHPVRMAVTDPLERSRMLVAFRLLLLLPHLVWYLLWGIVAALTAFVAWVVALVIGRVPRPLWRFLAAYVRYSAHLFAFGYMVGGAFPGFTGAPGRYPIDVTIEPAGRQRRLVTLFRLPLAVPALLLGGGYGTVLLVVAVLGWFAALFTARMPEGLRNIGAAGIRYTTQGHAYLLLVTDRYPYSAPFLADTQPLQLTLEDALDLPLSPTGEAA